MIKHAHTFLFSIQRQHSSVTKYIAQREKVEVQSCLVQQVRVNQKCVCVNITRADEIGFTHNTKD